MDSTPAKVVQQTALIVIPISTALYKIDRVAHPARCVHLAMVALLTWTKRPKNMTRACVERNTATLPLDLFVKIDLVNVLQHNCRVALPLCLMLLIVTSSPTVASVRNARLNFTPIPASHVSAIVIVLLRIIILITSRL